MILNGHQKKTFSKKQIIATKMRGFFFFFRSQIMFAYFSKKRYFYKNIFFHSQPPKNIFSLSIFWNFHFSYFVWEPFSSHLNNCPKNIFAPLHIVFLRWPKNNVKLGQNKQKQILDQIWAILDQILIQKTQILDPILSLQHTYIHIYIL